MQRKKVHFVNIVHQHSFDIETQFVDFRLVMRTKCMDCAVLKYTLEKSLYCGRKNACRNVILISTSLTLCVFPETEELAVYVKREFQRLGYRSADFSHVPVDMSDGSRELLLALAWLLHSEQVFYKFSMNCTTVFDDDTASLCDVC